MVLEASPGEAPLANFLTPAFAARTICRVEKQVPRSRTITIEALAKGLEVLSCFSPSKPEWALSELSDALRMYKSRVHRILETLVESGFVVRDQTTLKYRLGWRAHGLTAAFNGDARLCAIARPYLLRLQAETQGAIHLRVLRGTANVIIEAIESPLPLRLVRPVGEASPLHFGASGKALLAFGTPQLRELALSSPVLARFTDRTIVERSAYLKELDAIRRRGFAFTDEEAIGGVRSVAAPILGSDGLAIAAVTSALPTAALPDRSVQRHGRLVAKCASLIGQAMGSEHVAAAAAVSRKSTEEAL